jgi:glycosyltransferase involved in cell wall biosynthesis
VAGSLSRLVSVVIPTYNYGRYLRRAIDSALGQTYRDVEVVVVDDGSTDETRDVATGFGGDVRYVYQDNRGPGSARNRGLAEAAGEVVAFLDADDYFAPTHVEEQMAVLSADATRGWVFSDGFFVREDGEILQKVSDSFGDVYGEIRSDALFDLLLKYWNFIVTSSVTMRKKCVGLVGHFDETLRWHQDYEFWLRIAYRCEGGYVDKPLVSMRRHPASWGDRDRKESLVHRYRLMSKMERLYPREVRGLGRVWPQRKADALNHLGLLALEARQRSQALGYFARSVATYPTQRKAYVGFLQALGKRAARGGRRD